MDDFTTFLHKRQSTGTLRRLTPLEKIGRGRLRLLDKSGPAGDFIDFSSNDYLALTEHPAVLAASRDCLERLGAGSGAARLMSGDLVLHHQLEEEVAAFKDKEAALVFGCGYMANIGVISALVGRGDLILSDRLNHASIYDGCRLAGAEVVRFRHNDPQHLEELLRQKRGRYRTALIIVESIHSMEGDRCPLPDMAALKKRFDCLLMVDEAHATGIFGPNGSGVIEEAGVGKEVDIAMGTFGKALGSYGAYVAAARQIIDVLINRARSFIYSTALPPAVLGASLAALHLVKKEPGLRRELFGNIELFKSCLKAGGLGDELGPSQIIPVRIGDSRIALEIAAALRQNFIFATAVRPPTVPEGTARLRFSITRHHAAADLERTAGVILQVLAAHQPQK